MLKKTSSSRLLLVILILAVLFRVITAFILGNTIRDFPSIADQFSYHSLALRVLDGHGFSFDSNWWPATRAGEPTAHWSYLYTLYLAAVYGLFGPNPLAARLVQAVLGGLLMPLLTYRVARQVFRYPSQPGNENQPNPEKSDRFPRLGIFNELWKNTSQAIPLLAAAWCAFYGYFIYFAGALMTETFYMIGILWTLDYALRLAASGDPAKPARTDWLTWLELGLAIGLTAIFRQVFLPFVPFLFLWLWWVKYRSLRGVAARPGAVFSRLLAGSLLSGLVMIGLFAPITLHNYRVFGKFVLLNTNAGYAFYWSNHPIYGSKYLSILTEDMPSYYDLLPQDALWMDEAALDRELLRRGIEIVAADPGRYLNLSIDRIPSYFMFWPKASSSPLSNLTRVFSYGLALPFILAGIVLWAGDLRKRRLKLDGGLLLLIFGLVYSAIHLLSWAGIRYRLPVDAVSMIFAARGLYSLGQAIFLRKQA